MFHAKFQAPAIDIKHVYYLMMLERLGSISKAANAMGVAQPSLSENITRLEKKLNTRLAIRSPRGVTLTEAGRYLALEGKSLVDVADKIAKSLRQLGHDLSGTVSIGLPPSLSQIASVPLTETSRIELPGIKLELTEGLSGHILEWLVDETLDFGFVYFNPQNQEIQVMPVMEEEIFLVSAHDDVPVSPDANGELTITANDLDRVPLVLPRHRHSARRAADKFAQANGIELNVEVELNSLSQIIELVSRASACTLLPRAALVNSNAEGRLTLTRIVAPTFIRTTYLARKQSRVASLASMKVEQTVLSIIKEMIERYDLQASYIGGEPMPLSA